MTPKPPHPPTQLLDDLESIRELLGEQDLPLLTERLDPDSIPLLSDVVASPQTDISIEEPELTERREPAVRTAFRSLAERHLDHELRMAANLILQEVIDDFVPQIEAELKRRLEVRVDELIRTHKG
ncbi:DNA polymerase III subunit chi [Stutzerimonas stutzeri]|uniref:DNA polymerase III subunit chi n=1 Tax=Stutzerimonas sp. S1 TaxID=3030652 RepID=UPI0022248E01|nr:DNA polymerase III subunit chi [Stutzerimonas sp. S1]MCW3148533.1 DNA polymerase III subunit chi [Stutzerimonas sp. S1]